MRDAIESGLGRRTEAVMDAARCGQAAEAEEAIHLGADLAATDTHGMTALHYASARGSLSIVQLLIKYGAPLDAVDSTGMAPLHSAVIHDRTNVVSKLLAAGCAVDIVDARGFTPLHHAASTGQLAMVRLLVEAGCASLQIKTRLQLTPLLCAVEKRRCNTIRYLADAQEPPFVLPAEPNDFLPSCPNPSVTLSRFLKTLPPRPSQAIQNDAEVRSALGPRSPASEAEEAKVKAEVEKVKGERSVSLVRREAEGEEEQRGTSGGSRDGSEQGEGRLGELLNDISADKDSGAKRSEMWTGRRDAARCVTGMVRRALVQREYGEQVEREVRERARLRWAAAVVWAAMERTRRSAAVQPEVRARVAQRGVVGRAVRACLDRQEWRRQVQAARELASCVQRRGAGERLMHLKYIHRTMSAELLAAACTRTVRQRGLRRTLLLVPPTRDTLGPRMRAAMAAGAWRQAQLAAGRLNGVARRAWERRAWLAEYERREAARGSVGAMALARAARVRAQRRRESVRVLCLAMARAAGTRGAARLHDAARVLQGVVRGRGARVEFWRMQGEAGMERCSVLERRKQAKLRQPSWKREQFQRELLEEAADASRPQAMGAGMTSGGKVGGVWWPCFAVDHVGEGGWTEAEFDDSAWDYGREWGDGEEGCERVLQLSFGASVSLPRPLSARPPSSSGRPGSASARPESPSGRPGTAGGAPPEERPATHDIHLDRPLTGSANRPPLPNSRPPTSAGRPGTSAGRPGTSSGRPGTSSGRPETSSGRPGTRTGSERPGTGGGRPGTASGGRHFCGEENAEEVVGRWGAAYESISLVDDDDLAEAAVENMVAGAGRSISEGFKCWLALCIARRRLRASMARGDGRNGPEKGLARLKEHAEQGARERRGESEDTEGRLTSRQRVCALLHVGHLHLHLGQAAQALKAFTAARSAVAKREEREGQELWACTLSPHPSATQHSGGDRKPAAAEEEEEEESEGEGGVGLHVEVGLQLVGVVAQANCAACLLQLGANEQAMLQAEAAMKLLTRASPIQVPPPSDRPASRRSRSSQTVCGVGREQFVEEEHVEVVRGVMAIVEAARVANGQTQKQDVVVLAEEEKGRRRESVGGSEKRGSGGGLTAPEAWSTQPLGRLGCFGPAADMLASVQPASGGAGSLGSARTSSQQVAKQISSLLEPSPAPPSRGSSSSSSSSGSAAGGGEEGDAKKGERKRFGPNGATWRMTHGTRPLSGSRQKAMGFDPDIGRHAPYLTPSSSGTILGGRNGQPVN